MQLDCKGSLIAANKPTENNSRSSVGNFRISNLEGFSQKVKCEACSQLLSLILKPRRFLHQRQTLPGFAVSTYFVRILITYFRHPVIL
jgi:hypothetical protein